MRAFTLLALLLLCAACTPDDTPQGTNCIQEGRRGRQVSCN